MRVVNMRDNADRVLAEETARWLLRRGREAAALIRRAVAEVGA